jgi:septum formation protein
VRLYLASQSPRRRELLSLLGFEFTAITTQIDEQRRPVESPADYACRLSREKARAAANLVDGDALFVAADTIVVDGREVLGKPADAAEARAILSRLRGRLHTVYTAVTLLDTATGQQLSELASSPVRMRPYTDNEIEAYIKTGDPFDKAGAYAIQHPDFHPAAAFEHCFANVMGLPLCHIARMLGQMGIKPPHDVPLACQSNLDYTCPVYEQILSNHDG